MGRGCEITESLGGMSEAVAAARELARADDVFLPDQFSNPANPEVAPAHDGPGDRSRARRPRRRAGRGGRAPAGRSPAPGSYLRERNPRLRIVAVEPRGSAGAVRRAARPAPHPGHRRGLRAAGAQPRAARRGDRGVRRGRDPAPRGAARGARACWRASPAAPRCGRRCRSPRARSPRASGSS